ncbi:hypothetical protein [Vreelandella profundi]|uniref:hypothetical protein n=1 Tax=Vreelandella profundi TaxID=2852117 RepID=UPI001EF0C0E7|nr:hypothetical protein [Halomonas profundi]
MFRKLIKTKSFRCNVGMIVLVSLLASIIGISAYCIQGKTATLDWFNLANSILKFSAWFMFGYGTLQAFGRKIEHDNIERKIIKIDHESLKQKNNNDSEDGNSKRKEKKINEQVLPVYKKQVDELDKIEKDNNTTVKLYVIGVIIFFFTSLADIVLPVF